MSHINWKLSLSMKAPRFPLVITFVTSKEEMSGIIQVMPLSASLQLWKPQAKKHTSFSMRKMTLKTCKRLDTFPQCRAIWRLKKNVNPKCPLRPKKERCFLSSLLSPLVTTHQSWKTWNFQDCYWKCILEIFHFGHSIYQKSRRDCHGWGWICRASLT